MTPEAEAALARWEPMGFYADAGGLEIVLVTEDDLLLRTGTFGAASPEDRTVWLDVRLWGYSEETVIKMAAHELGHVLLETKRHLPAGERGLMQPGTVNGTEVSEADWALACATIDYCR